MSGSRSSRTEPLSAREPDPPGRRVEDRSPTDRIELFAPIETAIKRIARRGAHGRYLRGSSHERPPWVQGSIDGSDQAVDTWVFFRPATAGSFETMGVDGGHMGSIGFTGAAKRRAHESSSLSGSPGPRFETKLEQA